MITWLARALIRLNCLALTIYVVFSGDGTQPSTIALEAVWQAFNNDVMHVNKWTMMRLWLINYCVMPWLLYHARHWWKYWWWAVLSVQKKCTLNRKSYVCIKKITCMKNLCMALTILRKCIKGCARTWLNRSRLVSG